MENITYENLIDFTVNEYMNSDSKVEYLLRCLDIKKENLEKIHEKYNKFEKKMKVMVNNVETIMEAIDLEDNKDKFTKFIEKYKIKNDYNKIIQYLNLLRNFSMLNLDEEKRDISNNDEEENEDDDYLVQNVLDKRKNIKKEEEKLRKEIALIVEKEPKFLKHINIYLKHYLNEYINNIQNDFYTNIKKITKNIKKTN